MLQVTSVYWLAPHVTIKPLAAAGVCGAASAPPARPGLRGASGAAAA